MREGRSWEKEACAQTKKDRYTCTSDGKIQCLEGWIGDLCQVPVCGNECDPQHGYCVKPGECKCNLGYQVYTKKVNKIVPLLAFYSNV